MLRLALLGDPVSHSRSPAIFRAALSAAGIEGDYEIRQVDSKGVLASFEDLRSGRLDGLNITMPHKSLAASLCDQVDSAAQAAGSVNTVVRVDRDLVGYSTDVLAIRECWGSLPASGPVLILGAGGSAAAAVVAITGTDLGSIYIASRTFGSGSALGRKLGVDLGEVRWGVPVVLATVVNCTPVGMKGEQLPRDVIQLASGLLDMPYAATPTPAVIHAGEVGLPVVEGLEVLVAQAGHGFRLWTGVEPPLSVMRQAVENS